MKIKNLTDATGSSLRAEAFLRAFVLPLMVVEMNMNIDKQTAVAAKKARKEARRALRKSLATESTTTADKLGISHTSIDISASQSNANRPLPAPSLHSSSNGNKTTHCTISLFYQYKEPSWTSKEHKGVLNKIHELAKKFNITGRGRCAPEGLNCTLTASDNDIRAFCYALRAWQPELFNQTDFKLEDGVDNSKRFRTFTLRKVDELVGYTLDVSFFLDGKCQFKLHPV